MGRSAKFTKRKPKSNAINSSHSQNARNVEVEREGRLQKTKKKLSKEKDDGDDDDDDADDDDDENDGDKNVKSSFPIQRERNDEGERRGLDLSPLSSIQGRSQSKSSRASKFRTKLKQRQQQQQHNSLPSLTKIDKTGEGSKGNDDFKVPRDRGIDYVGQWESGKRRKK